MNSIKAEKVSKVQHLRDLAQNSSIMIVSVNNGLSVSQVNDLRRAIREANATYLVAKNTLARLALKDTSFAPALSMIKGAVSMAYANDPVVVAKVLRSFCKENQNLKICGAVMGDKLLPSHEVEHLAELPSLDTLRAGIIGILCAPATKVARVTQEPAAQLARLTSSYAASKDK